MKLALLYGVHGQ